MNGLNQESRNTLSRNHNGGGPISVKMESTSSMIHFRELPILIAHFPRDLAEKFLRLGKEIKYPSHVDILRKGQIGRDMFLICEGISYSC